MEQFVRTGRALRDDEVVADQLALIEQAEVRTTTFSVAGGKTAYKQNVIHGPTLIEFPSIVDGRFRSELDRLAAARRDLEIGRRDRGWVPPPIDVELDDGTSFRGVQVQRPINGFGTPEVIAFNAFVPER